MRAAKSGIIVFTLLNLVIIAMIAVVFFIPKSFWERAEAHEPDTPPVDVPPDEPPDEPTHNKLRKASDGAADEVLRETRLMGLGDETAEAVFFVDGKIYIFGNATVKGLDFDSYGGFVCRVSEAGTIEAYSYFEGNVAAACLFGKGFLAAAGDKLYSLNAECEIKEIAKPDGETVDIFPLENGKFAVVTQPTRTSLKLTEFIVSGEETSAGKSTRIDSGYTLKYFDCYVFSESYVIAARAHSLPRYDSLVLYSFRAGGEAEDHNYGGTDENITRPYDVMPYGDGYVAVASKNGVATLIAVDYGFTVYTARSLGFAFTDACILFSSGKYFVRFDRQNGGATYKLREALKTEAVTVLDGVSVDCIAEKARVFCGGVRDLTSPLSSEKIAVNVVKSDGASLSLDIKDGAVYAVKECSDGYILVLSAKGGTYLSAPSGGRDIYVLTVKPF